MLASKEVFLQLKNVTKEYPGVKALKNVSLDVRRGEVHGLLGENGAGKSTLIKVLSGAIRPNGGEIIIEGTSYSYITPALSESLGIGVVYQEFNLMPAMTVAENIFIGQEHTKYNIIYDKKKMVQRTKEIFDDMGISIDPNAKIRSLSVAYQQLTEIAKAISRNLKILVMDEPTAPLTNAEVDTLFKVVRRLKEKGIAIIFISHRMEEIYMLTDRVSVLRDGNYVITADTNSIDRETLIRHMIDRQLTSYYPERHPVFGETALEIRHVYLKNGYIKDINFHVRKGEILGLGGLVGAGRTEVARGIVGADVLQAGQILVNGKEVSIHTPRDALNYGIVYLPEDRKNQGLHLNRAIRDNISFPSLKDVSKFGIIDKNKEKTLSDKQIQALNIKTPSDAQKVVNLSGGNQQKVVVSKWLAKEPEIMIFDEPTRGIDVGVKYDIYCIMEALAAQGKAIIMISSEMPELIGMADRIIVMHEGHVTGELGKEEMSQDAIMRLCV